jgi:Uma2 family endonuclease
MYRVIETGDENDLLVEEPSADYSYTYADYLKWKFEDRLELFRGKIFKLSAPNTLHQKVAGTLYYLFRQFLNAKPCPVFIAPFDVRLPIQNRKKDNEVTTVVQPDVCVVCDENKIDTRGCCGAPDLIVEILSPGNSRKEVTLKFELYEEAGVREYWIVHPAEQTIIVYKLINAKFISERTYAPGDILESYAIEGLQINVTEIFEN